MNKNYIINTQTGNCVLRDGRVGKKIQRVGTWEKVDIDRYIENPRTGKYILRTSRIGCVLESVTQQQQVPMIPPVYELPKFVLVGEPTGVSPCIGIPIKGNYIKDIKVKKLNFIIDAFITILMRFNKKTK